MTPGAFGMTRHVMRGAVLGAVIAVVAALQYLTPPSRLALHAVYLRAYYLPIFLGGIWYGTAGGVLAALVSVAACTLDVDTGPSAPGPYLVSQYAEFAVFLLIGAAVGLIATREGGRAAGYRDAVEVPGGANRELAAWQEDLRRADRSSALTLIAAGLVHEIERPVNRLKSALDVVAERAPNDVEERDVKKVARRELRRLEALVSRLVAYTQPCEPRLEEVYLPNVVERVRDRLAGQSERRSVSIEFQGAPSLPPLVADPRQIEQVLFNVTLNAVQASARGGRVTMRIAPGQQSQVIEVIDDGPGIAREYQHRIFEPFFTTKERGVGLGLAIAQRIVEAHYGTIELRRGASGGTLVRIELPQSVRPADAASGVEARSA